MQKQPWKQLGNACKKSKRTKPMPNPELVERVAQALHDDDPTSGAKWEEAAYWPEYQERRRKEARAALKVHEEWLVEQATSPAMLKAGRDAFRENGLMPAFTDKGGPGQQPIIEYMLAKAWPKMITAALAEE